MILNLFIGKAYIPCCAHNGQLVIKDGLNYSSELQTLLNKVATIVGRCRKSTAVQEELRNLSVCLLKRNATRWNSTLFMIRSVLKLTPDDFKSVVSLLPRNKDKPKLSSDERARLYELKEVLEYFEEFTNNLQSDSVTISKVYPAVSGLKV